jgi:hypothetical protein
MAWRRIVFRDIGICYPLLTIPSQLPNERFHFFLGKETETP